MERVDYYEPLCYQCVFGTGEHSLCNIGKECAKCSNINKQGFCRCMDEKPENEQTCPYFKYLYLRG